MRAAAVLPRLALAAFAAGAAAMGGALAPAVAQQDAGREAILVVDVKKVLTVSAAARALAETERKVVAAVQARLERVKAELEAEERALAEAKGSMPQSEFIRRGKAFDLRARRERRAAQERAALLIKFFEDGRAALRARLPETLERLREERGAVAILDAGSLAAWDPDVDVTAAAAALFDEILGDVTFTPPSKLLER